MEWLFIFHIRFLHLSSCSYWNFLMVFSQCIVAIILYINYIIHYSDILYFIKLLYTIIVISVSPINIFILIIRPNKIVHLTLFTMGKIFNHFFYIFGYLLFFNKYMKNKIGILENDIAAHLAHATHATEDRSATL
jgi:hypothetical protein